MKVTYKNLTFNYTDLVHETNYTGETNLIVPDDVIDKILEHYEPHNIPYVDCPEDEDIRDYISLVENSDVAIIIYNLLLQDYSDEKFTLDVSYEHVTWLYHDLLHADFDVYDGTIFVTRDTEKKRIDESFTWFFTENGYVDCLHLVDMMCTMEEQFLGRFPGCELPKFWYHKNRIFEENSINEEYYD